MKCCFKFTDHLHQIPDQSGPLFPDWFRELISAVKKGCVKATLLNDEKIGREGAEREQLSSFKLFSLSLSLTEILPAAAFR